MTTEAKTADRAFLAAVEQIADEIAAVWAGEVDEAARFPHEAVDALKEAGALSALVPANFGGGGVSSPSAAAAGLRRWSSRCTRSRSPASSGT